MIKKIFNAAELQFYNQLCISRKSYREQLLIRLYMVGCMLLIIIKNKFQNEENTNSAPTRLIEKGRGICFQHHRK